MNALKLGSAAALLAGLAACQTPVQDPLSTVTTAGNYQVLANCFALSQPGATVVSSVARTGFRTVTVTTQSPSRTAASTLIDARNVGLATAYSTAFTEVIGNNTMVAGAAIGPNTVPFFWRNVVIPQLRTCTGNPLLS